MKKSLVFVIIILMLSFSAFGAGHRYVNGKISAISGDSVTVGGVVYTLNDDTKFFEYETKGHSVYKKEIRKRSVRSGNKVALKVVAKTVLSLTVRGD